MADREALTGFAMPSVPGVVLCVTEPSSLSRCELWLSVAQARHFGTDPHGAVTGCMLGLGCQVLGLRSAGILGKWEQTQLTVRVATWQDRCLQVQHRPGPFAVLPMGRACSFPTPVNQREGLGSSVTPILVAAGSQAGGGCALCILCAWGRYQHVPLAPPPCPFLN